MDNCKNTTTDVTKILSKLNMNDDDDRINRRLGRGKVDSGLTHECGVFGAIGTGEWPTNLEISQIICWGLVALQHR